MRDPYACRACGYPIHEHSPDDRALCDDVAREMAAEETAGRLREESNHSLWVLARSVGK